MKITRQKLFKRIMRFYSVSFNIREPYRVLVDGTFLMAALKYRMSLTEKIPQLLGGQCNLVLTPCIIDELRQLPEVKTACAIAAAKRFRRFKCYHDQDDALTRLRVKQKEGQCEDDEQKSSGSSRLYESGSGIDTCDNSSNTLSAEAKMGRRGPPTINSSTATKAAVADAADGEGSKFVETTFTKSNSSGCKTETDSGEVESSRSVGKENFADHPSAAAFLRAQQERHPSRILFNEGRESAQATPQQLQQHDGGTQTLLKARNRVDILLTDASRCIRRLIGQRNKFKFCVATQDPALRRHLRAVPGVPLIIILKGGVVQLEEPTAVTKQKHQVIEKKKLIPSKSERRSMHEARRKKNAMQKASLVFHASARDIAAVGGHHHINVPDAVAVTASATPDAVVSIQDRSVTCNSSFAPEKGNSGISKKPRREERKTRKKRGINPLSCKKSRKLQGFETPKLSQKKRVRSRRRPLVGDA